MTTNNIYPKLWVDGWSGGCNGGEVNVQLCQCCIDDDSGLMAEIN